MAKRYPPEVVDLANGGMFRVVVGRAFNYKNIPESLQGVDPEKFNDRMDVLEREAAREHAGTTDKRNKYVGGTPSKWSDVGKQVLERMHDEDSSQIKNMPDGTARIGPATTSRTCRSRARTATGTPTMS